VRRSWRRLCEPTRGRFGLGFETLLETFSLVVPGVLCLSSLAFAVRFLTVSNALLRRMCGDDLGNDVVAQLLSRRPKL